MAGVRYALPLLICLLLSGAPASAAAVDAQQACVAPVQRFSETLETAQIDAAHRGRFLDLVRACQAVYLNELQEVERQYAELPPASHCRQMGEEFREALDTLGRIERTAAELPLASAEDRAAAEAFYRLAAPGIGRAVQGLFILHYGVCLEEARLQPDPLPSSNATISSPDEARSRL